MKPLAFAIAVALSVPAAAQSIDGRWKLLAAEDLRKELPLNPDPLHQAVTLLRQRDQALPALFDCTIGKEDAGENLGFARLLEVAFAANRTTRGWQINPAITAEQLRSFYKAHFRPDNLVMAF